VLLTRREILTVGTGAMTTTGVIVSVGTGSVG
jgi:hypothetical protein